MTPDQAMLQAIEFLQSHTREHFTLKPAPAPDPLIELRLTRLQILAVLSALAYYDESERPYIGGQWIHLPSRIEMQRVAAELAARANAEPSRVGCHVIGDAE